MEDTHLKVPSRKFHNTLSVVSFLCGLPHQNQTLPELALAAAFRWHQNGNCLKVIIGPNEKLGGLLGLSWMQNILRICVNPCRQRCFFNLVEILFSTSLFGDFEQARWCLREKPIIRSRRPRITESWYVLWIWQWTGPVRHCRVVMNLRHECHVNTHLWSQVNLVHQEKSKAHQV